jgi:hypothetical protein
MNTPSPRPLPQWSWVLATLFFPSGLFVAYGCARLLSWARAIPLTLLSYGCVIGFVLLMSRLDQGGASGSVRSLALLGGVTMFSAWGILLYRIGLRVGYWSPTVQRSWRRAGWIAVLVLGLAAASVGLQVAARAS